MALLPRKLPFSDRLYDGNIIIRHTRLRATLHGSGPKSTWGSACQAGPCDFGYPSYMEPRAENTVGTSFYFLFFKEFCFKIKLREI